MNNVTLHSTNKTMFYSCNNDRDWSLNHVSGSCRHVTGYGSKELLNGNVTLGKLISQHFQEKVWEEVQISLTNKIPYNLHYTIDDSKKNKIIIYEQAQGVFNDHNEVVEIIGFMSNVTSQADMFFYETKDKKLLLLADDLISTTRTVKNCHRVQDNLKPKELETLIWLCKGYSMKEIANNLLVSPRTIEMYLKNLKTKLCCFNKSELRSLFYATETGPKVLGDKDFY